MSFRGGDRGRGRGRGGFSARGGGRGGFRDQQSGPPAVVLEMGEFLHACEGEMVCISTNAKVPYFNGDIFLENKTRIGKVDEILGPINSVHFTVKTQDGIVATSFKHGDKVYISSDKLLPLERFLPKPKPLAGAPKPKRIGGAGGAARGGRGGFGRGAPRGGRGAPRGGRGAPRGGSFGGRGGFSSGGRGSFGSRGGGDRGRGGFVPRGRGFSSRGS